MKGKTSVFLHIIVFITAITLSNCAKIRKNDFSQYNLSLNNTLSIFLLNNEKGDYFCIPVQYTGDYQISKFKFINGDIIIGDYKISLKRNELIISVYLNETSNEDGDSKEGFNLIYLEENGKVSVSKMAEPLPIKISSDHKMNHYYIFFEKYLTDNEKKNIIDEYKKRNSHSVFSIWYDLTVDNEEQNGSGMLDNFELYDGPTLDPALFPPNLNFFKAKYLQK